MFSALDEHLKISWAHASLRVERAGVRAEPDPDGFERPADVGELFDRALERMHAGEGANQAVLTLREQLHTHGAHPVRSSAGLFFLAPYDDFAGEAGAPQVRGQMNAWSEHPDARMRRVRAALWGRFMRLPTGRHAYKLLYPGAQGEQLWFTDPASRHIEWDGFDTGSVGAFNSVVYEGQGPRGSRMVWWPRFASELMQNEREVYVHLPAGYDAELTRRYPVLIVQDGNESIVRSQFHEVADAYVAAGGEPVILVFVALPTQADRLAEYTMASAGARGDAYVEFLATELVPALDASFRTRAEPGSRGVMGASLGGLISFWAALEYPGTFEYTGGMSSSFFWEDDLMLREVERRGCQGLGYYIDSGSPADNADVTRAMKQLLERMGCDMEHVEQPGATHDWSFWRGRFPNVLRTFERRHAR